MRKITVLMGLFLLSLGVATAQESSDPEPSKFSFAVIYQQVQQLGGSSLLGHEHASFTAPNFNVGLQGEYQLSKHWALTSGLQWAKRDITVPHFFAGAPGVNLTYTNLISLNYIEVPLGLRYYTSGKNIRMFMDAGAVNQLALNTNSDINRYVLGYKVGAGLDFRINDRVNFQFTTHYNANISNIAYQSDYKLQSLAVGLGLQFKL